MAKKSKKTSKPQGEKKTPEQRAKEMSAFVKKYTDPKYIAEQVAKMEAAMPELREKYERLGAEAEARGDKKYAKACKQIITGFEKIVTSEKASLERREQMKATLDALRGAVKK